jgi:hypothetical protein
MPFVFFVKWRWKRMSHIEAEDFEEDVVRKLVDGHPSAYLVCTAIDSAIILGRSLGCLLTSIDSTFFNPHMLPHVWIIVS